MTNHNLFDNAPLSMKEIFEAVFRQAYEKELRIEEKKLPDYLRKLLVTPTYVTPQADNQRGNLFEDEWHSRR